MMLGKIRLTRAEVLGRVRRFAALRAAQRALVPSMRDPSQLPGNEGVRGLRDDLQKVVDAMKQGGAPLAIDGIHVAAIDESLDGYAERLRQVTDGVAIAQFRASLSETIAEHREEAAALLDLVLEDDTAIPERFCLIDYLVTLLSIAKTEAGWCVVIDPSNVSELTRAIALEAPEIAPESKAHIMSRFQAACERLRSGGDFETVVREMGAFKTEIVPHLFHPEILRCLVSYNLALRIFREEQLLRARTHDRDAKLGEAAATLADMADSDEAELAAPSESAFGSTALKAIETALVCRLSGRPSLRGPAATLADRLDLSRLQKSEIGKIGPDSADPQQPLLRRVVTVGLIAQQLPALHGALGKLGIDPLLLSEEWLRELSDQIRAVSNDLIVSGRYEEAKELSELQSRLIPFTKSKKTVSEEPQAADPSSRASVGTEDLDDALRTARRGRRKPPRVPRRERRFKIQISPKAWVAAALVMFFLGTLVSDRLASDRYTIDELSSRELLKVSPYLVNASEDVDRGLFMGILSESWFELEDADRRRSGEEIRKRVAWRKLDEVMLFDQRRALKVHYQGELNRLPGWKSNVDAY